MAMRHRGNPSQFEEFKDRCAGKGSFHCNVLILQYYRTAEPDRRESTKGQADYKIYSARDRPHLRRCFKCAAKLAKSLIDLDATKRRAA